MPKKKFFYGWIVALGACVAGGMMLYMSINSISLFVAPATAELGVTATAFLVCATLRSLGNVLSGPVSGKLLDAKGIRYTMVLFGFIMAAGYGVLAVSKNLPLFYVGYFIVGIGSGPAISFSNALCARWFHKNRGLANGIVTAGNGLISFVLSPALASVIAVRGCGQAYGLVVGLLLVCTVGITLLVIRNDPSDMGLLPDGGTETAAADPSGKNILPGLTMKEIYKTKSFWLLAFGLGAFNICSLGIVQTWNASFQSLGVNAVQVAFAASLYGIACIPAKMLYGTLTDRISLKTVTVIGFGIFTLASVVLGIQRNASITMLYVFAVLFALGNSSWQPLFIKYIVHCFGLKSVGEASGVVGTFMNAGGMIGPLIAGAFFDLRGMYGAAYLLFALITAVCCCVLLLCRDETCRSRQL